METIGYTWICRDTRNIRTYEVVMTLVVFILTE